MVEVEGSRVLVPSCSRKVEQGMVVRTDTERARHSRRLVLELLGSSVDLSIAPDVARWNEQYGVRADRFGPAAEPAEAGERDALVPGEHHEPSGRVAATVHQPVKVDNDLYVRDYAKCILCYKCVDACGEQWQNTFAISVAGRGFDARISTEFDVPLPDSACVYCGNCIAVCPTGALAFTSEFDRRAEGTWDEERQTRTDTICPYCGVGLHPHAPRAGQRDRQGHLAPRPLDHLGQPLHQGPLRLPARPEPRPRVAALPSPAVLARDRLAGAPEARQKRTGGRGAACARPGARRA